MLEESIKSCPFKVLSFHADNGSEYINHRVAEMLTKLHVEEFTKSRPRRSNDNALVESKNGNVIRRYFGYGHIPKLFAREVNVLSRHSHALPELPPPVRVPHRGCRPVRKEDQTLPIPGHDDAVREAQVPCPTSSST